MRFSLDWLRQLCPAVEDADRAALLLTARGLTVESVVRVDGDSMLEIDVPANRPDCLGHLGVVRELAAGLGVPLAAPAPEPEGQGGALGQLLRVEIAAPALCPRYTARLVRGVRVGPSPAWVARRLSTCGLRPINNVVDASNLVLLELGHPIHLFDFARVQGRSGAPERLIEVRCAAPGELLRTLDGVSRRLEPDMLVIADARAPLAIAGVMGGAESEVGPSTTEVLIEAACFQPQSIRRTSRRLGLATEASYRFERGVDPAGAIAAQSLAVRLLADLAGGKPAPGLLDVYPAPAPPRSLTLRASELRRLLGFAPDARAVEAALAAVGLTPRRVDATRLQVEVPSWRLDLEREVDLVEEVARHLGYDQIPASARPAVHLSGGVRERALEERSRDMLAHFGFHEAMGYAMIGAGADERFVGPTSGAAVALANPLAEQLSRLRRSILPGLLGAVDFNLRRDRSDIRLFEAGRVFLRSPAGEFPLEPLRLGIAWSGAAGPRHWSSPPRPVDLFDLAGLVEWLLQGLAPGLGPARGPCELTAFHPGRSACWRQASGQAVAWGGALHPELQREFSQEAWLAELDLGLLAPERRGPPRHAAVARVPAASRDLSLVLAAGTEYSRLLEVLCSVDPPAPVRFEAVDRYEGAPLGSDEVSLTVRFTLAPRERTLTDEETETYRLSLLRALGRELGARLR